MLMQYFCNQQRAFLQLEWENSCNWNGSISAISRGYFYNWQVVYLQSAASISAIGMGEFLQFAESMTQCKMEVRILSGGVTKNLTLHGMSKIDFQPDFRNALMLSFLIMYNTIGSKVDGLLLLKVNIL